MKWIDLFEILGLNCGSLLFVHPAPISFRNFDLQVLKIHHVHHVMHVSHVTHVYMAGLTDLASDVLLDIIVLKTGAQTQQRPRSSWEVCR